MANEKRWICENMSSIYMNILSVQLISYNGTIPWEGRIKRGCARRMTSVLILWAVREERGCARHITSTQADLSYFVMVL